MQQDDLINLGIALGLGLLAGLQREHSASRIAGIRTFTLIALFGAITGILAKRFDNVLIIAIGLLCLALLLFIANYLKKNDVKPDIGQTTEVAVLLMYMLSAYLVTGSRTVAVVVGGALAVLLYLKESLSRFSVKLGDKDMRAIFQFVAISLVILPILPNTTFGPYDILNLREIWLMVVLIVGLSIVGYFAYKWLGKNKGKLLNGILGGLISSTATTLTYSRRSKEIPTASRLSAFIIVTASTISFVRVIIEVAVVAPNHLGVIIPPLVGLTFFMSLLSAGLFFFYPERKQEENIPEPENPAQLKTALFFGLLYAVILVAVAAAKDFFGQSGLFAVSILSGLTDMNAITLSMANTVQASRLEASTGWKLILVAGLSNIVFKGGIVFIIGDARLRKQVGIIFSAAIAVGVGILFLWPE